MPGECNPACQKLIINGHFMAIAAEHLANVSVGELLDAAVRLATAARYHVAIADAATEAGIMQRVGGLSDWNGCDQAEQLHAWLMEREGPDDVLGVRLSSAVAMMNKWADDEYAHAHAIISGGKLG